MEILILWLGLSALVGFLLFSFSGLVAMVLPLRHRLRRESKPIWYPSTASAMCVGVLRRGVHATRTVEAIPSRALGLS